MYDGIKNPFYDYTEADNQSLIHAINLLGYDLVGAEVGVFRARSFLTKLSNCPNIKILYGVDSYKPYTDYLGTNGDSVPFYSITQEQIDEIKKESFLNQSLWKEMGGKAMITFLEEDSGEAAKKIKDGSLDFVFLDTFLTFDQLKNDLETWFPKVRVGGLFAGHDFGNNHLPLKVNKLGSIYIDFHKSLGQKNPFSSFDNCWAWIKS